MSNSNSTFTQYRQYRIIGNHKCYIFRTGVFDYTIKIDGGAPVYIQTHRPATFFALISRALDAASEQCSLNLKDIDHESDDHESD